MCRKLFWTDQCSPEELFLLQIRQIDVRPHPRGWRRCETALASLLLWGNAVNCVDASSRRWRRPCKWPCLLCRNLKCKLLKVSPFLQTTYSCPLGTGRCERRAGSRQSSSDTRLWSAHWKFEIVIRTLEIPYSASTQYFLLLLTRAHSWWFCSSLCARRTSLSRHFVCRTSRAHISLVLDTRCTSKSPGTHSPPEVGGCYVMWRCNAIGMI